ncbi:MAG: hypothetical protein LBI38_07455 [Oscillospiraceae bacterium]|nr:hypothetical protein [Oscillospiraceae bacterium]
MENNKKRWFCSCEKEAGLDICEKCRERVNAPDYEDIIENYAIERKPRNITLTAREAIPVSKEIVEKLYSNANFDTIYNELERFIKIVELVNEKKPDGINTDTAISYLTYASIYAANTRPRLNELNGNN